jgi:hypothetical protein
MKYPPARRLARPARPTEFPPTPLLLELQAAGRRGDELLARYLDQHAQDQARRNKIKRLSLATLVVVAYAYHLLHPEWPFSLLPAWLH